MLILNRRTHFSLCYRREVIEIQSQHRVALICALSLHLAGTNQTPWLGGRLQRI